MVGLYFIVGLRLINNNIRKGCTLVVSFSHAHREWLMKKKVSIIKKTSFYLIFVSKRFSSREDSKVAGFFVGE